MKPYCTQNNGECETCSLGSYGRDCQNNPVKRPQLYHVWGRGPAQSALIRDANSSEAAARTALAHGFDPGADCDAWAVEVEASEAELDAATRHDPAVIGYAEARTPHECDTPPCPDCRGSTQRGRYAPRYDADRGQWLVYRGGWYPCPICGGTGELFEPAPQSPEPPRGSKQLSLSAVAELLGITKQALSNRISRGTFPGADGYLTEPGGDRPYWLRATVLRYQIERIVGPIAGLSDQGGLDNLRETYHLDTDTPLGAQLTAQGLLTEEQGRLLDDLLPVYDSRGTVIDYEAAVNLMDDELREELHDELPPCSRQAFLIEYAGRHETRFGTGFAPWTGEAW